VSSRNEKLNKHNAIYILHYAIKRVIVLLQKGRRISKCGKEKNKNIPDERIKKESNALGLASGIYVLVAELKKEFCWCGTRMMHF